MRVIVKWKRDQNKQLGPNGWLYQETKSSCKWKDKIKKKELIKVLNTISSEDHEIQKLYRNISDAKSLEKIQPIVITRDFNVKKGQKKVGDPQT